MVQGRLTDRLVPNLMLRADLLNVLQVNFEPREVVVNQGDVSDCMYVLKSGQVCAPNSTSCRLGACVDR